MTFPPVALRHAPPFRVPAPVGPAAVLPLAGRELPLDRGGFHILSWPDEESLRREVLAACALASPVVRFAGGVLLDDLTLDNSRVIAEVSKVLPVPGRGQLGSLRGDFKIAGRRVSTTNTVLRIADLPVDLMGWSDFDGRLDYFLPDVRQTRLSTEVILATGDTDRGHTSNTFNGNSPDTTDNSFNGFGLLNTGLAFAPDVSNILIVRGGVTTFPFADVHALERLQLGADVFFYSKFYGGAPIDETTGEERYLGWEPDVYLNWQITSDITLALRYGIFFPSEDNFANDDARQFFYGGVTFAF